LSAPNPGEAPARDPAVDVLKALGILAVVFIHVARYPWPGSVPLEGWLSRLCHFAVPGFLAASGYLYATLSPISAADTRRRLVRIVVPYLVVSLLAQLWWLAQGRALDPVQIAEELLFASSFGPYYYVFQIFSLVLLAPLVPMLPKRALLPLTLLLILAQLFVNSLDLPLFWGLRIPLFSGGSFLYGWTLRVHAPEIGAWLAPRRPLVAAGLAAVAAACSVGIWADIPEFADRTCEWIFVNAVIGLVFVAAPLRARPMPAWVRSLSDSTYAIYLVHLFFIYTLEKWRPLEPDVFDVVGFALYWVVALAGSLALVALARLALGRRSRLLLGA
jgi:peptidoglycan/LPS O-acetylase OafA/YrhL